MASVVPCYCIDRHGISLSARGLPADHRLMTLFLIPNLYFKHYSLLGFLKSHSKPLMTSIKIFHVYSIIDFR
jgi:hypothetical protein